MVATATAIYEKGTLRLLTPISLPERTRVRVQIQEEDKIGDDMQRAAALPLLAPLAAGLRRTAD
jgi:predicted DNA-binding antitoxin AbrB/MazE fold protein